MDLLQVLELEAKLVKTVDEPFSAHFLALLTRLLRWSRLAQLTNAIFPLVSLDVPENVLVGGLAAKLQSPPHLVAEEQF